MYDGMGEGIVGLFYILAVFAFIGFWAALAGLIWFCVFLFQHVRFV